MNHASIETDTYQNARAAYTSGNFSEAYKIWLELAEAGDADSQAWIGSLYANGEGVDLSDEKAFYWYFLAAKQNNYMAQSNIGAFYFMGRGVEKNVIEAVYWLSKSAEAGDLNSQFNLAVLYSKGDGVEEDHEKAAALYRKASEMGHYPSQSRLGYCYAHGKGVLKDRVQAYLWLSLAAQHGIGTALEALESVVKDMSLEEKTLGASLFEEWRTRTKSREGQLALNPTPN